MIIERKCGVPEMLDEYIRIMIPNEYHVDQGDIDGMLIKCDGIVIGTLDCATNDYLYGYIYSPKYICGEYAKKVFTYEVEVERKPMSPLEKILDDSSKSMNLYYKAMDAIYKAKKEKENE